MESQRPLILITNDDGIDSPGLRAAIEAVHDLGDLLIAAPIQQQSSMGRSLARRPHAHVEEKRVLINGQELKAYALDASPAQTVLYAILVLAETRPTLAISGINFGENLGTGTTISGTVGAALQAGDMGVPALAISLETDKRYHYNIGYDVDWRVGRHFTREFAQRLLENRLPHDVDVIKVDIPATATPQTPWRITRQSRQPYYTVRVPPGNGRRAWPIFDYVVEIDWATLEPDSDIYVFARERLVSVTPLSVDLTARVDFEHMRQVLDGI